MTPRSLTPWEEPSVRTPLEELAARIQDSSNFLFAWQFFRFVGFDPRSSEGALSLLQTMIAVEECQGFLRQTFDPMYGGSFEIEPVHQHCRIVAAEGDFENVLAAAANNHLGAYSSHLGDSTPAEVGRVRAVFEPLGPYRAFQLLPGATPGCDLCAHHANHVFSSWFYGVAWDWCFVLTWPKAHQAWIGCLTDTD